MRALQAVPQPCRFLHCNTRTPRKEMPAHFLLPARGESNRQGFIVVLHPFPCGMEQKRCGVACRLGPEPKHEVQGRFLIRAEGAFRECPKVEFEIGLERLTAHLRFAHVRQAPKPQLVRPDGKAHEIRPALRVRAHMGPAKSYAERLFDFPDVGPLPPEAARYAIEKPARDEGVEIESDALDCIVAETHGYPYFLQEWGKRAWDGADESPIDLDDVKTTSRTAMATLDASFFRVRFDRLTPLEMRYLRAMPELGAGPHRSGEISDQLGREVTSLAPTRSQLIAKGMVWSPGHGDTAFTVPLFDGFMRRIMPGEEWRSG